MQRHSKSGKTALCALMGALALPVSGQVVYNDSHGQTLNFAQTPTGQADHAPAPDVILSIDDSSHMGSRHTPGSKMAALRSTLTAVFSDQTLLPDGKIRLAWQAMWNPGNTTLTAGAANSMKVLDATHRAHFLAFVNTLDGIGGSAPAHKMMRQAFEYMNDSSASANSPWSGKPGVSATPWLACRRAYHILMTDGQWNAATVADRPTGSASDYDNIATALPDGAFYDTASPQTRIYRDPYNPAGIHLADWAFRAWATDLNRHLSNQVTPDADYAHAPATESIGRGRFDKFWNPRYDPATWQHLATYVIGYGPESTRWASRRIAAPTGQTPYGWNGGFPDLMDGTALWPLIDANSGDSALDLWHAAINGRGLFFAVTRADDLKKAFQTILQRSAEEHAGHATGMGASGSANIYQGVEFYTAGYDAANGWSGYVYADQVSAATAAAFPPPPSITPDPGWGGAGSGGAPPFSNHATTADKLDGLSTSQIDDRLILTTRDTDGAGVLFKWAADDVYLSAAQKALLALPALGADGEMVLNFLRGDKTRQTDAAPPGPLRPRPSRQGDIVHSGVWYVGAPVSDYSRDQYAVFRADYAARPPMIYVGGNDGMLHGFSARTGEEKIAYIPKGLMDKLKNLADPRYAHAYYVDNTPFSGDVEAAGGGWKTVLVGTLGAGGRGYFVLDITDPSHFTATSVLLDRTQSSRAAPDPASGEAYLGHILAPPALDDVNPLQVTQITRMNNHRWAVVLGNGYHSASKKPALLIQYLDGPMELKPIPVSAAVAYPGIALAPYYSVGGNGLSAPRVVDLNGDGTADVIYAGDLEGHLWKFDVTSAHDGDWGVAFGGQPLYTAAVKTPAGKLVTQPIFAPPAVAANDRSDGHGPVGGVMVAFGTGADMTVADRNNGITQTIYAVLDNTRYENDPASPGALKIITAGRGACTPAPDPDCVPAPSPVGVGQEPALLWNQTVNVSSAAAGTGASAGLTFWNLGYDHAADTVDWTTQKGWFMNLPARGERLLTGLSFYDGGNILQAYTQVPATSASNADEESCIGGGTPGRQFLTLINIMDGKPPTAPLMDLNGDHFYNPADYGASASRGVARVELSPGAVSALRGARATTVFNGDVNLLLRAMPDTPARPSWRQIQ